MLVKTYRPRANYAPLLLQAGKVTGFLALFAILALQLVGSSRRNSATWDEGHHLYSGYLSWKTGDYGINPEVPPLVKMVAAIPLLRMPLEVPPLEGRFFKDEAFFGGHDFLFHNDADVVLFRARMAAAVFSFVLALLVFLAAQQMFSTTAGLIALGLLVFDPNFLAHGALVTTDVGAASTFFATIYAFYRWRVAPSWARLLLVGLVAGLALATKFTGILVVPILALLAWCEWAFPDGLSPYGAIYSAHRRDVFKLMLKGLPIMAVVAYIVLWGLYGFRYAARPRGLALHPAFAPYIQGLHNPLAVKALAGLARFELLPESWLYGLADTKITADSYTSYFFGHVYPHGNWLYFPAAFAIKSTLPLLLLLPLVFVLVVARRFHAPRELLYMALPALLYFLVAANSNMNIGARHLLPIYPFLYVLAAGAAATLIGFDRRWVGLAVALVAWQAADAWSMYPAYMAFGNGLWGGPEHVHLYLSDANVDWGQQLNDVRAYLATQGIRDPNWAAKHLGMTPADLAALASVHPVDLNAAAAAPRAKSTKHAKSAPAPVPLDAQSSCWFAYFPDGVIAPSDYGVPCKRLPTADTLWWEHDPTDVPASIDGLMLISDSDLQGIEFGEGPLNPYEQFRHMRPIATIDYGVYVYQGHFDIPLAAGLNDAEQANNLLKAKHLPQALAAAQQAVALAPNLVPPQVALGDVLAAMHRAKDARACYQRALTLAQTVEPQLQTAWIPVLKAKLAGP
ncbi:MAG: glycosyltransferase family 39 protein [Acidobacteriaceae bacterium]